MSELPANGFEAIDHPIHKALDSQSITPIFLAKRLKKELNAKEVKAFKSTVCGEDGECGDEIIYSKPLVAWGIRQKARMDAHKLRGDYPAEKHDLSGSVHVTPQFTPEDRELLLKLSNQVVDGILREHRRTIARD